MNSMRECSGHSECDYGCYVGYNWPAIIVLGVGMAMLAFTSIITYNSWYNW
jgi:hypothetical protein